MKKKDKYIISIVLLSLALMISIIIICLGIVIINDLNDTIERHKNTIGVCTIDLKQVQEENDDMRKRIIELERK